MTEKSKKQIAYEDALEFRLSFRETSDKLYDYFHDCNDPVDLKKECSNKLEAFFKIWSDLVLYYKIEWDVEEGIVQSYHPANKLALTLENYRKKQDKKIEALEKEIEKLKEAK